MQGMGDTINMCNHDIDFVILWVDGNDPDWIARRQAYRAELGMDISTARYRDWDNLVYWFRAVEKFAPWVRKVHFISDNQIPAWLNINHPKLHIVDHTDYLPADALPIFNSNAIELALLDMPDLSEHFVLFNDDLFLLRPIEPDYYFTDGIPNDMAGTTRACSRDTTNVFSNILCNDYEIINKYFDKNQTLKKQFRKWYNIQYGKAFFRTVLNSCRKTFDGIVIPHMSVPYVKSDWQTVWQYEEEALRDTQYHRFRQSDDVSHFLFRFWRLCQGNFCPKRSLGKYYNLRDEKSVQIISSAIRNQRYPEICINDNWAGKDFEKAKEAICAAFSDVLGTKSSFER